MSAQVWDWLAPLLATDSPVLPEAGLVRLNLCLGWSVVLAWLGVRVAAYWTPRPAVLAGVALLLALWAWLPGPLAPTYWLGLAFQAPSWVTVLLCAGLLYGRCVKPSARPAGAQSLPRDALVSAVLGVVAGWALLLDAFALLPVQLYAWGFSPLASALVWLVVLLPWAVDRNARTLGFRAWVGPWAVLLFVAVRLPSGNVWDAVLDPWLWLVLHGYLLRAIRQRY